MMGHRSLMVGKAKVSLYLADRGACNGTWGKPVFDVAFETMIIRGSITLSLSVQKDGNFETCFE